MKLNIRQSLNYICNVKDKTLILDQKHQRNAQLLIL